ncbi:MAG: branched-chain amino acid ABC transporter permease [Clostridia bacterium]
MMEYIKKNSKKLITIALPIVAFVVVYTLYITDNTSRHTQSMLVPICVNIILALSLNLVVGFLGELSLGHAGFMSVGAYGGALFSIYAQDILPDIARYPLALLVGGCVAGLFGIIVGIPVLRLKGDYLAIVTLAFGEIIRSVILNLDFTGGASGLTGTPQDSSFVSAFVVVMIVLILTLNITNSREGRAITSVRDNVIAAESCGLNVNYYKLITFVISAFIAGVAGAIYSHNYSILSAGDFDYIKSIEILLIVVLGGIGSIRGSIIAAVVITILPEALRGLDDYRMLIYAILLIAIMLVSSAPQFAFIREKLNIKSYFGKKGGKKNA